MDRRKLSFTRRLSNTSIERGCMAILVTGGTGYIGSVTIERLIARGEQVVVLDDLAHGHRAALPADIPFYSGKTGDRQLVARIAREHTLESCIHFAALIEVGESVLDPARYFENNVGDGIALLGELLQAGVRRLVFSSTAAAYGDPEQIPITEQSRKWPKNPYGWSKLFMERILDAYDTAYGMKFVALRYFNAAGATENCGEDHRPESHLIPNVLAAALGNEQVIRVFGNNYPTPDGTPIRDYIHVVDLADAHIRALEHLRSGGQSDFLNLGTGRGYSVLEVIECVRKVTGRDIPMRIEPPRAGDPAKLIADPSRAKALLGWEPAVSDLHTIVRTAWDWRLRHPQGYAGS
jgi:UDP-glucose 4-epimerase